MTFQTRIAQAARSLGDPAVVQTGPSSLTGSDRMARRLGFLSLGLGLAELTAPQAIARRLGVEGKEALIRAAGARELVSGITSLSIDKRFGILSRVGGDLLDIASLAAAYRDDNPKRSNVGLTLAAVVGVTLLDVGCAQALSARHRRSSESPRDYSRRSGFPRGVAAARGAAADFAVPEDMRALPASKSAERGIPVI